MTRRTTPVRFVQQSVAVGVEEDSACCPKAKPASVFGYRRSRRYLGCMGMEQPVGRRRLDLAALSPDEFEQLCYLAIEIEHKDAVHIANPDCGVDVGLPTADRAWARCWQSKRFTGSVSWPQCKASLDVAVKSYGMAHYTLCFARDLTANQEALFKKHLVGRHKGVKVDYWGQSKLEALFFSSAQGERIANAFFGDPTNDTRSIMRAIRAQGALDSATDVMDRLGAIAEYLERGDPLYSYVTVTREIDAVGPALTPGTVVSAVSVEGGIERRIDAIPRSNEALRNPPSGTMYLEPNQAEALQRFMLEGGEVSLEGVALELKNLPAGLPQPAPTTVDDSRWDVLLRGERPQPTPWDARFIMTTSAGSAETLDFNLRPGVPPAGEDWDAVLQGALGGLEASMLFQRGRDGGNGAITVHWSYSDTPGMGATLRSRLLAFVVALLSGGNFVVQDRAGVRPQIDFDVPREEVDPRLRTLRQYVDDVVTLEQWVGYQLPEPEVVPRDEARAIHVAAAIVRDGRSEMNLGEGITLSVPRSKYEEIPRDQPLQFLIEQGFGLAVFGTEIPIGSLRGIVTDLQLVEEESMVGADGEEFVRIRVEPTTDQARHPTFELVKPPQRP